MKCSPFIRDFAAAVLLVCGGMQGVAGGVQAGDDMATVTALLGEAKGYMRAGTAEWYFYERGQVRMRDGRVETADLVSKEQVQAMKAEREQQHLRRERARLLSEQQERLRAEDAFRRTDNEGALSSEAKWKSEQAQRRRQEIDMALRVREAEARTRRAEQMAQEAWSSRCSRTYTFYPSFTTGYHPAHRRTVHRSSHYSGGTGVSVSYGQPPCHGPFRNNSATIRFDNGRVHGSISTPFGEMR
ncbi:MAG TPA: hypothetical protein DCS43_16625 [Verrucomicrobia bacterium]|nr:hypothetical protein [Verrucomicrobiota bacterium]